MKNDSVNWKNYKPIEGESNTPARVRHALKWAGKDQPMRFAQYNEIAKAVFKMERCSLTHASALQVRTSISRVRVVMLAEDNLDVVVVKGIGVRATTSDEDRLHNALPGRVSRAASSVASMNRSASGINPAKLGASPMKTWMLAALRPALKLGDALENAKKLLPAPKVEDGKNGGKR